MQSNLKTIKIGEIMKTKKFNKKLSLNKKTIVSLNNLEMDSVKGLGPSDGCEFTEICGTTYGHCDDHCRSIPAAAC